MNTTTDVTWRRLRELIKKRDKSICFHCGQLAEDGHCDHLIPVSKGGTDSTMNLVWSCASCNLGKSDDLVSNDTWFKQTAIQEQKSDYPSFKRVLEKLAWSAIKAIIPPYSEYDPVKFESYQVYFGLIDIERSIPILSWLRNCIWSIPADTQCILDHLKVYDKLKKRVHKSDSMIETVGICPECNRGATSKLVDKEVRWSCSAGHSGLCNTTPSKVWLERMRNAGMMLAFDQTFPGVREQVPTPIPDWLENIDKQ